MTGTAHATAVSMPCMERPGEVTAIAVYHALFSVVLVGVLVWQGATHHPVDGWLYAAPVLIMLLFLSLVPAVLAFGLWVMDGGARIGCMIFTVLHALSTIAYLQHSPSIWRPWGRLALDAVMLAVLMLPRIRRAFDAENRLLLRWDHPD